MEKEEEEKEEEEEEGTCLSLKDRFFFPLTPLFCLIIMKVLFLSFSLLVVLLKEDFLRFLEPYLSLPSRPTWDN